MKVTTMKYTVTAAAQLGLHQKAINLYPNTSVGGGTTYIDLTVVEATVASSVEQSSPADLIQQVGMPAIGCTDVRVTGADWAGVASDGWSQSWAEWVNNGKGGAVCTRTLAYNNGTGAWFVRP